MKYSGAQSSPRPDPVDCRTMHAAIVYVVCAKHGCSHHYPTEHGLYEHDSTYALRLRRSSADDVKYNIVLNRIVIVYARNVHRRVLTNSRTPVLRRRCRARGAAPPSLLGDCSSGDKPDGCFGALSEPSAAAGGPRTHLRARCIKSSRPPRPYRNCNIIVLLLNFGKMKKKKIILISLLI